MGEFAVPWRWIGTGRGRAARRSGEARRPAVDPRRSTSQWTGWTRVEERALSDMSAEATASSWTTTSSTTSADCSASGTTPRPPTSPTSASTRSSIAGRNPPASPPPTASSFHVEKAMGWVADVFSRDRLKRLPGHRAIGHVRYSTAGSSNLRNAQPISAHHRARAGGASPTTATSSTPRTLRRRARAGRRGLPVLVGHRGHPPPPRPRPRAARSSSSSRGRSPECRGAYTLLLLTPDVVIVGLRDPSGFRPLLAGPPG